jgi:Fic family protein
MAKEMTRFVKWFNCTSPTGRTSLPALTIAESHICILSRSIRFKGGLSAGNYVKITGASPATATRDLADLIAKKALFRTGTLRHARYELAISLRPGRRVEIDAHGNQK